MPKTKLQRDPPHQAMRILLEGWRKTSGKERPELAKIMRCSCPTVTQRFKNPGNLTLDELTALGRGLHIPIEDLRAAIKY